MASLCNDQSHKGEFDASTIIHSTASQLISEWKETKVLPDALQIYQLGQILSNLPASGDGQVRQASQELLASFPTQYLSSIFRDLHHALLFVLRTELLNEDTVRSPVAQALISVSHLYTCAADFAPRVSDWTESDLRELVAAYSSIKQRSSLERNSFLSILSRLFWTEANDDDELHLLHLMQEHDVWGDFVEWQDTRNDNWRDLYLEQINGDEAQKAYLQSLLHSREEEPQSISVTNSPVLRRHSSLTLPHVTPEQEMHRRIQQVRQILPDLGEGFVEAALSYYKGHVEQTLSALLDDTSQLPETLRLLDRTLPRRRGETLAEWSPEVQQDAAEAREITKTALRVASAKEEADAYAVDRVLRSSARDEYADDYDDQYDSLEPFVNDNDYDAILSYNRIMKQVEQDHGFWDSNRNTNRENANTSSDNSASKFRGPDKLRGGRVPKAAKGGGAPEQTQSRESDPSSGRGGAGGRGGRGGRGRGGAGGRNPVASSHEKESSDSNSKSASTSKFNQRKKDAVLAKRKEKQKQAAAKRLG